MTERDTLNILIVDDEALARQRLVKMLEPHADCAVVRQCKSGREAVAAIAELKPDLVLLDIQMPAMTGFDVIEAVGVNNMPAVVFVTAYDEYAIEAFEVSAIDYLLKPFDRERFERALEKARREVKRRTGERTSQDLRALLERVHSNGASDRLVLRSEGRIIFLNIADIDWIQSAGNYVEIHSGREKHLHRETMKRMAERLAPHGFIRTHRTIIVNPDRIKHLEPHYHGDYVITLRDGTEVPLSRRYRSRVERQLGSLE